MVNVHQVLSIAAKLYLEMIRNWTMNTQQRWIFACAQSAGVSTSVPAADEHPSLAVLSAAARDSVHWEPWSGKTAIRERLAARESREFDDEVRGRRGPSCFV
jgi:hypothetical protein